MDSINSPYHQWPGLEHYYLEDSYVHRLQLDGDELVFDIDVVLTKSHPEYAAPKPGEQYCYRLGHLSFRRPRQVSFVGSGPFRPTQDPDGSTDFGNIDALDLAGGRYRITGDWGVIEVEAEAPTLTLRSMDRAT